MTVPDCRSATFRPRVKAARGMVGVLDDDAPFLGFGLTQTLFWRSWLRNRRRRVRGVPIGNEASMSTGAGDAAT